MKALGTLPAESAISLRYPAWEAEEAVAKIGDRLLPHPKITKAFPPYSYT